MIYLCAGVFAEGRTDYAFLLPLVTRLLFDVSTAVPWQTEVADSVGIDASRPIPKARAPRIAKAIQEHQTQCSLFVVHADADGDPDAALVDPVPLPRSSATAATASAAGAANASAIGCLCRVSYRRSLRCWLRGSAAQRGQIAIVVERLGVGERRGVGDRLAVDRGAHGELGLLAGLGVRDRGHRDDPGRDVVR